MVIKLSSRKTDRKQADVYVSKYSLEATEQHRESPLPTNSHERGMYRIYKCDKTVFREQFL